MTYSKSSKTENDLLKIQQERERERGRESCSKSGSIVKAMAMTMRRGGGGLREGRRTRATQRTRGRESARGEGGYGASPLEETAALRGRRRGGRRSQGERWAVSPAQSSAASADAKDAEKGMEEKDEPVASSFIREHLRELAPYTPILPFEVLSEKVRKIGKCSSLAIIIIRHLLI